MKILQDIENIVLNFMDDKLVSKSSHLSIMEEEDLKCDVFH
jgi:hypothetical protein